MDEARMMDFVHKAVGDVGAVLAGSMVVIGDRRGLYRAMTGAGAMTSEELAAKTGTNERFVREWLGAQAAAGYVSYAGDGRYELPDEHAVPLTDETSPACVVGAFETAVGALQATDRIADAFVTGEGIGWGDHDGHVHTGCERFFRPGYINFLTSTWIPALDGGEEQLMAGAKAADVGCGHGASNDSPRADLSGQQLHRVRPPRRVDRGCAQARRGRGAWPTGSVSRSPRPSS